MKKKCWQSIWYTKISPYHHSTKKHNQQIKYFHQVNKSNIYKSIISALTTQIWLNIKLISTKTKSNDKLIINDFSSVYIDNVIWAKKWRRLEWSKC